MCLAELQKLERAFREGRWSWPDWIGAAGIDAGAKVKHFLEPVKAAAQAHESHPVYLALGQAVAELLASGIQVEDKATKTLRAIQPGDIGVLCRKHDQVDLAVTSLTQWGIPSASPRAGLLGTAEAIFVLACLRRMHDVSDTVASALVLTLADGIPVDTWLADRLNYLGQPDVKAHEWKTHGESAHPLLARLEELRPAFTSLTPLEALRLAAAESHVAQLVAQWSNTPHEANNRLANVEALVELGKTYEDECIAAKRPATVSGMLRWLEAAAEAEDDGRASSADNAVTVLTYHGSKGLEWPVVVLSALGETARGALWNVRARTEGAFDPQLPLGNRFIHCWLKTWGKRATPQAALNAEASATGVSMQKDAEAENKRLLYVGLTRARDVNVLVSFSRKAGPVRSWVDEVPGASQILFGPTDEVVLADGQRCSRTSKDWKKDECAAEPPVQAPQDRHWFIRRPLASAAPLWYRPSSAVGGQFTIAETADVGIRIALTGKPDMADLGTAVHHCIARAGARGAVEQADVSSILSNWGVGNTVDNAAVVAQLNAFRAWRAERWPGCPTFVEVPIEANRPDGTRVRGRIDLLVQSSNGWILVDHKSNPGGADRNEQLTQEHGPQLAAYAEALVAATGTPVAEQWLYLPVAARALRLA